MQLLCYIDKNLSGRPIKYFSALSFFGDNEFPITKILIICATVTSTEYKFNISTVSRRSSPR